jgi:hypothetical protein
MRRLAGVQTVEEFPDGPLGSEHVKGHMLTVHSEAAQERASCAKPPGQVEKHDE